MLLQIWKIGTETQIYKILNQSCERRRSLSAEVKDKVSNKTAWGLKRKGMKAAAQLKIKVHFVFLCFNYICVCSVCYVMREDSKAALSYDHRLYPAILKLARI